VRAAEGEVTLSGENLAGDNGVAANDETKLGVAGIKPSLVLSFDLN